MVDLSGAFSLEDLIRLAQKRNTKIILKGINTNVRRTLMELGIIQNIGPGNIVDDYGEALQQAIDYLAELYLTASPAGGKTPPVSQESS
jgi:hypothetical protein